MDGGYTVVVPLSFRVIRAREKCRRPKGDAGSGKKKKEKSHQNENGPQCIEEYEAIHQ